VDEGVPRVFGALFGQSPAGAVVVLVLASAGAHAAAAREGMGVETVRKQRGRGGCKRGVRGVGAVKGRVGLRGYGQRS
jgi:hypothetical protein